MPKGPKVMCIGGNFQLAEHARMFQEHGVVYVQPRGDSRLNPISQRGNRYSVVTLNHDGNFGVEQVSLVDSISLGDGTSRFVEHAKNIDLELISVGVSDGALKNDRDSHLWSHLAAFLFARYRTNSAPISLISTDNAFNNGDLLKSNIWYAIATHPHEGWGDDAGFKSWYMANVHAHIAIVDRMVMGKPGKQAAGHLPSIDGFVVYAEPIPQVSHKLIVQDPEGRLTSLIGSLPESERAMTITTSLRPYAVVKYEALNYVHTCQVHWSYLAGLEDVYADLQHPVLGSYARRAAAAKAEIVAGYKLFEGTPIDVRALAEEFVRRCDNPHLGHRNEFIVRNGTGKIVERVQGSVIATSGEMDKGMYGTIASILREKTPLKGRDEQGRYYGTNNLEQGYPIEDTDPFIMQQMWEHVHGSNVQQPLSTRVDAILAHVGLDKVAGPMRSKITALVQDLFDRPAMEVLQTYAAECFK